MLQENKRQFDKSVMLFTGVYQPKQVTAYTKIIHISSLHFAPTFPITFSLAPIFLTFVPAKTFSDNSLKMSVIHFCFVSSQLED